MAWRRIDVQKAAEHGDVRTIINYLDAGGDIAKTDSKYNATPLHWACLRGKLGVAEVLLSRGAPIEAHTHNGGTPVIWACMEGNVKIIGHLLDRGADMKAMTLGGGSALHHAASYGHSSAVELLLHRGADPCAEDMKGHRPGDYFDGKVDEEVRRGIVHVLSRAREWAISAGEQVESVTEESSTCSMVATGQSVVPANSLNPFTAYIAGTHTPDGVVNGAIVGGSPCSISETSANGDADSITGRGPPIIVGMPYQLHVNGIGVSSNGTVSVNMVAECNTLPCNAIKAQETVIEEVGPASDSEQGVVRSNGEVEVVSHVRENGGAPQVYSNERLVELERSVRAHDAEMHLVLRSLQQSDAYLREALEKREKEAATLVSLLEQKETAVKNLLEVASAAINQRGDQEAEVSRLQQLLAKKEASSRKVEEENRALRRRVEDMRKLVQDSDSVDRHSMKGSTSSPSLFNMKAEQEQEQQEENNNNNWQNQNQNRPDERFSHQQQAQFTTGAQAQFTSGEAPESTARRSQEFTNTDESIRQHPYNNREHSYSLPAMAPRSTVDSYANSRADFVQQESHIHVQPGAEKSTEINDPWRRHSLDVPSVGPNYNHVSSGWDVNGRCGSTRKSTEGLQNITHLYQLLANSKKK